MIGTRKIIVALMAVTATVAVAMGAEHAQAAKPSDLKFAPEVEEMVTGKSIEIQFAPATGEVGLWINDRKISAAASPASFKWKLPSRDKAYKVEIKKDGKVLVGRYIPKRRPFLFHKQIRKSAGFRFKDREPYKGWLEKCLDKARKAKSLKFMNAKVGKEGSTLREVRTYYKCPESNKGRNAKHLAFAWQMTGDRSYAEACLKVLRAIDPDNAKEPLYYADKNGLSYNGLMHYSIAYDWLQPYIASQDKDNGTHYDQEIQDRIAQVMNRRFLPAVFKPGARWRTKGGGWTLNDAEIVIAGCALLGYHGQYQDEGNPYQWIERAEKDLFEESQSGQPRPTLLRLISPDGLFSPTGYRSAFGSPKMAIGAYFLKNATGVNWCEKYRIMHGYFLEHVYTMLPCRLPYPRTTNWQYPLGENVLMPFVYEGEEGKFQQWYVNKVLLNSLAGHWGASTKWGIMYWGSTPDWPEIFATYDKTLDAKEPSPQGEPSCCFTAEKLHDGEVAVFRSDWSKDALYSCLKAGWYPRPAESSDSSDQMSYDFWAKGAYLSPDAGQCRWIGAEGPQRGNVRAGESGGRGFSMSAAAHNSILIDGGGLDRGSNSITRFLDPAHFSNFGFTSFLDFGEVATRVASIRKNQAQHPSASGERAKLKDPVDWKRSLIFPGNEYLIVLDRLASKGTHDYDMLVHYGGTETDPASPSYVAKTAKCVWGNLRIEGKDIDWQHYKGKKIDWRHHEGEFVNKGTGNVSWVTKSFTGKPYSGKGGSAGYEVELRTLLVPAVNVTYRLGCGHFGRYRPYDDRWHPFIMAHQKGRNIKYLTILYPRKVKGDPIPDISEVKVKGGSGDDYAARLVRGDVVDLVSISDGETITAGDMKTDAKIAYTRLAGGRVAIAMMAHGRRLSRAGKAVLSASEKVDHLSVGLTGESLSGYVSGKEGTEIGVFSPSPVRKLVFKPCRPNWTPRGREKKYEQRELKFTYRNRILTFKCPKEQGKFFVQ